MKITHKISLSFLAVSTILVSTAAPIFYSIAKGNLQKSIYNNLDTAVASRANHIETYLEMLKISVGQLSKSVVLENLLKINGKEDPRWTDALAQAMMQLERTTEANPSIAEFLLIDRTGKVRASSNESSVGTNKSSDFFFLGGQKGTYIKDVYYSENYKEPLMAVSAPLLDSQTGEFFGVLAARARLNDLNTIVTEKSGTGDTGEIYIVNKYGYMITPSRFKEDVVLKQKVDTENVRMARLHKNREHISSADKKMRIFLDYRGVQVLGAHEYIPQMQWAVLAEIDIREAFASLTELRLTFFLIFLIVPIVAWFLGIFLAKLITGPLHKLHKGTEIIGNGNLDYKVGTNAKDEVGQLCRAFDEMVENFKTNTTSIDKLNKEIAERKKMEEERDKTLRWQQDISTLQQSLLALSTLDSKLKSITDNIVRIFDADFCRIWLIRPGDLCGQGCRHAEVKEGPHVCRFREKCLHLMSSSGRYTHIDGQGHARVPFDCYKIGLIASGKEHKLLTNDVVDDPRVHNHEWARELGLVSFAGYQLRITGQGTIGVMALFAKHPILSAEDAALDNLSTTVAFVVQQAVAEDNLGSKTRELEAALKEAFKSREIVTSMLEDNNQVREGLEKSLKKLEEAQAQVVHAEKMEAVGRMASGIAHEVKNPLGIILQGINFFEGALPPEDKDNREILQMMKDSVKRADKIVRALLDFSRAQELKIDSQDINSVIARSIDLVRYRLKLNDIALVCELGESLPKTLTDAGKIEQLFVNLFSNAADAMPKGGTLFVRSYLSKLNAQKNKVGNRANDIFRLREEAIFVEVEDTGEGIDKDIMNKIFEPFFTTKNRAEGTGLGLSVAKSIVELHKGWIGVESTKGKGTKFTIVFTIPGEERG